LVEQRTENPRVGGSIPPLATIKITVPLRHDAVRTGIGITFDPVVSSAAGLAAGVDATGLLLCEAWNAAAPGEPPLGTRCPQTLSVIEGEACPSCAWTACTLTPAASHSEAQL
jgi:hypothetical protein